MRILVLSDSHRRVGALMRAVSEQPEARHVFFLGDVLADLDEVREMFPDRIFHAVCGNCDGFSMEKSSDVLTLSGVGIFFTHGHHYDVKSGLSRLTDAARRRGCQIALYGHTHVSQIFYEDGVYIVNPGSVAQSRNGPNSYAVIDITPGGILPAILTL